MIGRAVGATLGRVIDQRIMGLGSDPSKWGALTVFHVMGASEGAPIGQGLGPDACAGSGDLGFSVCRASGSVRGKGAPRPDGFSIPTLSICALGLCEGTILGVGRVWADGNEIAASVLRCGLSGWRDQFARSGDRGRCGPRQRTSISGPRLCRGIEGWTFRPWQPVPAVQFRGDQRRRVPDCGYQRPAGRDPRGRPIPGTGEYALATERVRPAARVCDVDRRQRVIPLSGLGISPFSLDQLRRELPNVGAVSLVVSWFGSDLRCGNCTVKPKVEQVEIDPVEMPWRAGGIGRAEASVLAQVEGRPVYGGTPADASVVQAIRAIRSGGRK